MLKKLFIELCILTILISCTKEQDSIPETNQNSPLVLEISEELQKEIENPNYNHLYFYYYALSHSFHLGDLEIQLSNTTTNESFNFSMQEEYISGIKDWEYLEMPESGSYKISFCDETMKNEYYFYPDIINIPEDLSTYDYGYGGVYYYLPLYIYGKEDTLALTTPIDTRHVPVRIEVYDENQNKLRPRGTTGIDMYFYSLSSGSYTLKAFAEGYNPIIKELTINEEMPLHENLDFQELEDETGSIKISTDNSQANIYIDEQLLSSSGFLEDNYFPTGTHLVKIEEEGFNTIYDLIELEPGKRINRSHTMNQPDILLPISLDDLDQITAFPRVTAAVFPSVEPILIPQEEFTTPSAEINILEISPYGKYMAMVDDKKVLSLINLESNNIESQWLINGKVESVEFSPKGDFFALYWKYSDANLCSVIDSSSELLLNINIDSILKRNKEASHLVEIALSDEKIYILSGGGYDRYSLDFIAGIDIQNKTLENLICCDTMGMNTWWDIRLLDTIEIDCSFKNIEFLPEKDIFVFSTFSGLLAYNGTSVSSYSYNYSTSWHTIENLSNDYMIAITKLEEDDFSPSEDRGKYIYIYDLFGSENQWLETEPGLIYADFVDNNHILAISRDSYTSKIHLIDSTTKESRVLYEHPEPILLADSFKNLMFFYSENKLYKFIIEGDSVDVSEYSFEEEIKTDFSLEEMNEKINSYFTTDNFIKTNFYAYSVHAYQEDNQFHLVTDTEDIIVSESFLEKYSLPETFGDNFRYYDSLLINCFNYNEMRRFTEIKVYDLEQETMIFGDFSIDGIMSGGRLSDPEASAFISPNKDLLYIKNATSNYDHIFFKLDNPEEEYLTIPFSEYVTLNSTENQLLYIDEDNFLKIIDTEDFAVINSSLQPFPGIIDEVFWDAEGYIAITSTTNKVYYYSVNDLTQYLHVQEIE